VRLTRRHLAWGGWVGLGLVGSLAFTAAASELLGASPVRWWLVVHPGSRELCHHLLWGGLFVLALAWLGLGAWLRGAGAEDGVRPLLVAGLVWAIPPLLGPALFSSDVYSYLAQGDLLRLGINPYVHGPAALAAHHAPLLATVSPFWRHTPAPYGPLFVGLAAVAAAIAGSHVVLGVLLLRAVELAGLALLAFAVPRLARDLGVDARRATWLAVISPLIIVEVVGGGHNDGLMAGLLACAVMLAVERRPLPAIAVAALAGAVKLPALCAVPLVLACSLRAEGAFDRARPRAERRQVSLPVLGGGLLAALIPLALVAAVTGVGTSWLSGATLSTPARVHLAITPATALGYSIHSLLGLAGPGHGLESALATAGLVLTALLGLVLLRRVRYETLAVSIGALLLVSVLAGPAAWPWYLVWVYPLLAVTRWGQRSWLLVVFSLAALFVIRPHGILMLELYKAPYVLAVYLAVALAVGAAWWARRDRSRSAGRGHVLGRRTVGVAR
jgi:hypothetical protein